ncbi:Oxysterol-binding protein-related protein 11, partial [Stegodyphus mimosarum]
MADGGSLFKTGASRSIYYSLTEEVPGLTEEEKNKLEEVMKKAQEFEAAEAIKMRQPVEGQLYKYTNVVKGWQYRWFVLTPDTGMLEYYMIDERRKSRPRGGIHLAGAVVLPNEEDNQSFSVNAVYGEVYKLKASDANDRQFWVNRIRSVIDKFSRDTFESTKVEQQTAPNTFALCKSTFHVQEPVQQASPNYAVTVKSEEVVQPEKSSEIIDTVLEIKDSVYKAIECQKSLARSIEDLPFSGPHIKCSDTRLLLIKAISQATVQSLEECYLILRRCRQREAQKCSSVTVGTSVDSLDKLKSPNL